MGTSDNQIYYDNPGESYAESAEPGTAIAAASAFPPAVAGNMSGRAMQKIENRVERDAVNARAHARLSGELIMNTVALSAIGENAARTAPGAAKAIQHIINVYACSSAEGLAGRWSGWNRY